LNRAVANERILYLRTFRGAEADYSLIVMVALAAAGLGRIWVLGWPEGKVTLHAYWDKLFNSELQFEQYIDYVECDDESWRPAVHQRISEASCIVLHLSPKGDEFPRLSVPKTPISIRSMDAFSDQFDEYYNTPLTHPSSGSGLLYEVAFLDRLKRMRRTLLICENTELDHIQEVIRAAHGAGMDVFDLKGSELHPHAPRLTALDNQLVALSEAHGIVVYSQEELRGLRKSRLTKRWKSRFTTKLRSSLLKVLLSATDTDSVGHSTRRHAIPLGKSPEPRRLPPDDELKVIQFTNVEDLLVIPYGKFVEVQLGDVYRALSADARSRGCPYCHAALDDIFFFSRELASTGTATTEIRGKCQRCGRQSLVENGTLVDV